MKTEMHLTSLVCKASDIPHDLKRELDSKNRVESIYNFGDEVMKFSCKENYYYLFFYMRKLNNELAILQFNICELIYPMIGAHLTLSNGELAPVNKVSFSRNFPFINNLFFGNDELNEYLLLGKNADNEEICLNMVLGSVEDYDSMAKIIPVAINILGFIYECALEINHSNVAPEDAKDVAKDYLRALISYKMK